MNSERRTWLWQLSAVLVTSAILTSPAWAAEGDTPVKPAAKADAKAKAPAKAPAPWPPKLSEQVLQKISDVVPDKPAAAPKKPRRLVVFTLTPGFKHTVIPATSAAIEAMGKKTGAWETVVSDDMSYFEPEKLAQFDAVVLNNCCGIAPGRELFLPANLDKLPPEQKQAALDRDQLLKKSFESFVRSGHGLVGIHGSTGAFHTWPTFGEMLGAFFQKHPWTQKIRVKLDDPANPICTAFAGKGFEIKEETYEVREPYSRDTLRVLLTLDLASVDAKKGGRKDGDYALAWIKTYGQGRVFYSAFSHYDQTWMEPAMVRFHLAGIQYALGDLEADATPSAKRADK